MKLTNRITRVLIISLLIVGIASFVNTTLAQQSVSNSAPHAASNITSRVHSPSFEGPYAVSKDKDENHIPAGVEFQDEQAAQVADIAILAKETGLETTDVERSIEFQQAFSTYAVGLFERYPSQISAVWTEPVPSITGHIHFVGEVPSQVISEVERQNSRTATNILLTGHGQIALEDHLYRSQIVAEALVIAGYNNNVTFYDPVDSLIHIELQLPSESLEPSKPEIVSAVETLMQESGLQGRATVVEESDLHIDVIIGSGPIVIDQHSRGGNWLRDDGARECTSGWSVNGPNGYGIITAAHCSGLNQFEQPGVTPYSMTWRDQEWGSGGDVEYHTTTHVELGEFYANSTSIRDALYYRHTNAMVGNSVCVYGRSSNVRTCNNTVQAIGVTTTASGVTVSNLARTNNTSTIGGDSGGGWSWGTTAWGVHKGRDSSGRGYYTPIEQAQNALNVTVIGP